MVAKKNKPSYEMFAFDNMDEATAKSYTPRFHGEPKDNPNWEWLTPAQQKKMLRDAKRTKVTYDFPQELIDRVSGLAEDHKVPTSQLAALLMQKGLKELDDGLFDLDCYKMPTRSPRFEYVLALDPLEK